MKKTLLGAVLLAALPAFGTTVQYTTAGVFSASGTNVLAGTGGSSITFNAVPNLLTLTGIGATPFADSLGYFQVTNAPGGSLSGSGTFTLTVNQVMPPGTGSYTPATFSGTIVTDGTGVPSGNLALIFNPTNITVAGVNYALENLTSGNELVIGTSITNVQADITSAVPEPLSLGLLGGGLALLGVVRWRKAHKS